MANEALVSWQDDSDMSSFTATMEDDEQALLSCNSVTTSCRIENLECGKNYAVTVQHHDSMCPGMPSEVFNLDSGKSYLLFFTSLLTLQVPCV